MRRSYPTPPRPCLMRAEHVNPDRVRAVSWRPGRPTVRRVEFSGGNRMSKKRMPVGESRQETRTAGAVPPYRSRWITGRIPDLVSGPRKGR
jgi:hypothetical protein